MVILNNKFSIHILDWEIVNINQEKKRQTMQLISFINSENKLINDIDKYLYVYLLSLF